jgi:hypothetical protein
MPQELTGRVARPPRMRPYTLVVWFLFLGLLVSLAANIREDRKMNALAGDMATLRAENQKQVAVARDAQSASLEQDLLRLDQLTTQVQKTSQDELQEATTLANRTRAELAKTVEQRHQEMIMAISDLRADLRSEVNAKASQLNQVQKPDRDAPQTVSGSDFPAATAAGRPAISVATLVADETDREQERSPPAAQKKTFWSKLNPFGRNRIKKQETADSSPTQ